jgi:predicted PurR-regulated permease PerM
MSSASAPRGRGRQSEGRTRPSQGRTRPTPRSSNPSERATEPAATSEAAPPAPPARVRPPTPRVALLIAAAIVIVVVLYMARGAVTPFLIGLVLVYLLDPPVRWLARRGVPAPLAVLIVYAVTLFFVVEGLALLLRPLFEQIAAFFRELPGFLAALDEQIRRATEIYSRLALPAPVRDAVDRAIANATRAGQGFDATSLLPVARTIAGTLTSVFGFLIVPVWAFYILKDRERLVASFDRALPAAWREDTWAILRIVNRVFGRWLRGQLILGVVVGVATFLGLLVLGYVVDDRFLQFGILLAVVAGLFELLPIIGPILSAIPAILIALTISPTAVLAVIVLYTLVQQVENNVLVPKIQGDAIELHPSVVIFALVIGGAIGGLLGAIFSLPVTAAARDVYRYAFRRLSGAPRDEALDVRRARDGERARDDRTARDPARDRDASAASTPPAPRRAAGES